MFLLLVGNSFFLFCFFQDRDELLEEAKKVHCFLLFFVVFFNALPEKRVNTILYIPVYGLRMPIYGRNLFQYGKIRDHIQAFFVL